MSFSLSLNGHHGDADAKEVENLVRSRARALRDDLAELGVTINVSFSGATAHAIDLDVEPDAVGAVGHGATADLRSFPETVDVEAEEPDHEE